MEQAKRKFAEAFDLLLKIQAPKSPNTLAQTKCVVKHLRWFDQIDLDVFETDFEEIWASFRAHMKGKLTKKGKALRLGHCRRYLTMALKRAQAKGWIKRSFSKKDFALNEAHEPVGKYVSDEDIKKLISALEIHPKTRLQVLMAVTMGMRLSEVLKLRIEEVDLEKKEINLDPNRLKTRRARAVPIPIANDVINALSEAIADAKGSPYVFPMESDPSKPQADNRYWWTLARRQTGIKCRFHDLRHSWASNMVAAGIPQEWITKVGGFTPQVLSRIYAHMRKEDMEQFRNIFEGRFK